MITTINLKVPLKRGDTDVTEITLREPTAGNLRGVHISDLYLGKVDALIVVIPRISEPKITEEEMRRMNVRDLASMAGKVSDFFLSEEEKAEMMATLFPSPTE